MSPKKELRVQVYAPCSMPQLPTAYPPSAFRPQFSPYDFSPCYTPLSARKSAYPKTPIHTDCPLDLNTPFETSNKYLRDIDAFFSTKLFRQNGDITSKVLPLPKPSPRQAFFKNRLPPLGQTLTLRDCEKRDDNYTTHTPFESDSDSCGEKEVRSHSFRIQKERKKKSLVLPESLDVRTLSAASESEVRAFPGSMDALSVTSGSLEVTRSRSDSIEVKRESFGDVSEEQSFNVKKEDTSPSPSSDSLFGRGMALATNPKSNVERLKANPDMWAQATQVKKGVYVCTHCPSNQGRFRKLSELAAHFDENNLTRLCKCDYPDCAWSIVGFSSRSEKTRHIKSQHASAQYECMHCERVFARSDSLKRHFKLIHNLPNVTPEELVTMRTRGGEFEPEEGMPPPSSTNVFVVNTTN
ncbi:Krueppel-like factor 15 [Yarrowia sp. B02]|nr:Krueppel-like factor 15 [Yarrowia sp. B02]